MKSLVSLIFFLLSSILLTAQSSGAEETTGYRPSATKINNLVHTKLDVKFDYDKQWLYGKAWLALRPHFYNTDSLLLDAKGMDIKEVSIIKGSSKSPLQYKYDSSLINIKLDKSYKATETYTVFVEYISKPNNLKTKGSAAITDAKGLYFINPKGQEKNKPIQIWTQSETEAGSVWFPTIDKPNQKTTQEILMTVPSKYVTLSNGLLISQKKNADNTRTDHWKMDLPHSPYLFFMGVGDYSIIKENYKGKEISYYVEKEYADVAKRIFGETPAMMAYFERATATPYAWPKYSQITGRDYVSGAMENTTATLHTDAIQQNARQLVDGNEYEDLISHELFHHWFGDLVTTENWSNLTINESFASYGEALWKEYRYGKEYSDEHVEKDRETYFSSTDNAKKDLVRFNYADKEDVFDNVTYEKGATILHMLRNFIGDSAFFKSLNKFLTDNKFKNAEAHQLRLAFEEITGQDLNWFFNQWYFSSGHPKLKINYNYSNGKAVVVTEQIQNTGKLFRLPVAINVYHGASKKRYDVWIENKTDTFYFTSTTKPTFINVDAEKILTAEKVDNKTNENWVEQWKHASNYVDKKEALKAFSDNKMNQLADGLNDKYAGIRLYTLQLFEEKKQLITNEAIIKFELLAETDPSKKVKAKSIELLTFLKDKKYSNQYLKWLDDSSYSVAGAALQGIVMLDPESGYTLAKKHSNDAKGKLASIISQILMVRGTEADLEKISELYTAEPTGDNKVLLSTLYPVYLIKIKDPEKIKAAVDEIITYNKTIPHQFKSFIDPLFKNALTKLSRAKKDQGNKELADHIAGLMK